MIDLYCERVGSGVLAEPINAITNLAFFVAAYAAASLARRNRLLGPEVGALIGIAVAIGIGSTLFHTLATGWARALDEVPILLFQLWYAWLYLRTVMKLHRGGCALAIAVYLIATVFSRQFPHLMNGSLIYVPALALIASLALYHYRTRRVERGLLLATAGVFLVSVAFRSLDQAVCTVFPTGTHFLWHILNGVVLYLSMRALLLNLRSAPG